MTDGIIEALQAERGVVLGVCAGLSEADWAAGSGCPGWSVQDVISHLGAAYWMVADPSSRPAGEGLPFERAQDAIIAARRHLSPAETLADYADISTKAIDILAGLLGSDNEVPLGDLGTYPAGILPTAFCFDHYAHTRLDLFPPRGPLTGEPPPAGVLTFGPPWTGRRPRCRSRTARSWPNWPGRWRPSSPGRERGPSRSGHPESRWPG